jgi:N-acetylneuraminic acid mutarotase
MYNQRLPFHKYILPATILMMILSCSKQNITPVMPEQKTASNLTVGGPPSIIAWLRGPVIPAALPNQPTTGRFGAFSFAINGKGYVGAGIPTSNGNDVWQYDTTTRTWSQVSDFPGKARCLSSSFVIDNNAYVCTGSINTFFDQDVKENWQYNQPTNAWTKKTNFPGKARSAAVAQMVNGKGYVGTGGIAADGDPDKSGTNDWWQYDPVNDSWTQKASIPGSPRAGAASFTATSTLGVTKIYVCAGGNSVDVDGGINLYNDLWEYNPSSDSWRQRASLPGSARAFPVGITAISSGIVGTGFINPSQYGALNDCWEYFQSSNTWQQLPNIPGQRWGAMGFALGNTIYIGTGEILPGNLGNDFWGLTFPSTP